jgi:DNA-binding MarR family transcriptional regulator
MDAVNDVSLNLSIKPFCLPKETAAVRELRSPFAEGPGAQPFARIAAVRRAIAARGDRKRVFNARLFSDPAWEMLLELYVASLGQRLLAFGRLADRAGVAPTTALRWVQTLENEGLVHRQSDQLDSRRVLLELTEAGRNAMDAYFDNVAADTAIL